VKKGKRANDEGKTGLMTHKKFEFEGSEKVGKERN
jgi:hypothetical protein